MLNSAERLPAKEQEQRRVVSNDPLTLRNTAKKPSAGVAA